MRTKPIPNGKGPIVAHLRPKASDVSPPDPGAVPAQTRRGEVSMTRAQAHALRRCAPLTPKQFKAKRRLADLGINPLRRD